MGAILALVPICFIVAFYGFPVVSLLVRGLGETSLIDVLRRRSTGRLVTYTTLQAVASALASLLIGLPAAWAVSAGRLPARAFIRTVMVVPFVLPTLVVAAATNATLGTLGLADGNGPRLDHSTAAVIMAHAMFNTSVVIRVVGARWATLRSDQREAAQVLGASKFRVWRHVTFPALAPAVLAALAIAFLFCFTSFGIILSVGGPTHPTLETEIWRQAAHRGDVGTAAALAVAQIVVVAVIVAVASWAERRAGSKRRMMGGTRPQGGRGMALMAAAPALALVTIPLMTMVRNSLTIGRGQGASLGFDHYRALAQVGPGTLVPLWDSVTNSLIYACGAALLATVIGAAAAVVVAGKNRPGLGRSVDLALMLPLGTSAVTLGFGILITFDEPPIDWRSTRFMVVIAQALIGIPFVVRTVAPILRQLDPRPRQAARTLGASRWRAWRWADGPIIGRALGVGVAFAFAAALGEFGATSFLVRPRLPTVPTSMFRLLSRPGEAFQGQAMALGTVLCVICVVCVAAIERLRPADSSGW